MIIKSEINYERFGFKMGSLHIYLEDGSIDEVAHQTNEIKGIESVEVHIGNSDLIENVIYKHSKELLDLITQVKKNKKIDKIVGLK